MKKTLLALILACGAFSVQAQDAMRIGVKGSFNSTWMFNNNVSDVGPSLDYASSFGSSFGAQFIYMFSESYGLNTEILYTGHNQSYDAFVGKEENNKTYTVDDKIKYIDIPLLFRMMSPKGPYFEIGPQFSFLAGAKETVSGIQSNYVMTDNDPQTNYSDKDFKDNFNGFGLSGILGFGVDIKLSDNLFLNTGLRFGYTFTDATKEYSEANYVKGLVENSISANATYNHFSTETDKFNNRIFDYQKSNRVWGGLNIGIQYQIK